MPNVASIIKSHNQKINYQSNQDSPTKLEAATVESQKSAPSSANAKTTTLFTNKATVKLKAEKSSKRYYSLQIYLGTKRQSKFNSTSIGRLSRAPRRIKTARRDPTFA